MDAHVLIGHTGWKEDGQRRDKPHKRTTYGGASTVGCNASGLRMLTWPGRFVCMVMCKWWMRGEALVRDGDGYVSVRMAVGKERRSCYG